MVDWLIENVNGFTNRKSARNYASVLLSRGLIKHVVNVNNFNEKCYYIFKDSIIAERLQLMNQQIIQPSQHSNFFLGDGNAISASTLKSVAINGAETNTDITYMSNPSTSPPFVINTTNMCNNNLKNTSQSQTKPIVMVTNPRYVSAPQPQTSKNSQNWIHQHNTCSLNHNNLLSIPAAIKNNTTWQFSPIYPRNNNNNIVSNGRIDCESPTMVSESSINKFF